MDKAVLPESVNILGTVFQVRVVPLSDGLHGESSQAGRYIAVDESLDECQQLETFYHELVHAILDHGGYDSVLGEDKQEALAQYLGMVLTYVQSFNELPKKGVMP